MKKKLLLSFSIVAAAIIINDLQFNPAHTNTNGAPAKRTGSPFDGLTCTSCHSGNNQNANCSMLISSTVPVTTGYTPGQTYDITVLMSDNAQTILKMGFEASIHNASGTDLGTIIASNTTETQIVQSAGTHYITHKAAGTVASSGSKFWTFQWTAPSVGTGAVTVYAAGNFSNNSSSSAGDVIKTTSLLINEHQSGVGMNEAATTDNINVFPNPATDRVAVSFRNSANQHVSITLVDAQGRLIKTIVSETLAAGEVQFTENLSNFDAGVYFVHIEAGETHQIKKMLLN